MKIYPRVLTFFINLQFGCFKFFFFFFLQRTEKKNGQKWKTQVQGAQKKWLCPLNLQICDLLSVVAVVVALSGGGSIQFSPLWPCLDSGLVSQFFAI